MNTDEISDVKLDKMPEENNPPVNEEEIEKILKESKPEEKSGEQLLDKMIKEDKKNRPPVTNEGSKVRLGELGSFECVDQEGIDEVFDNLNGIVFKMKQCMFRISYVTKGKRRFTATLINEKPK